MQRKGPPSRNWIWGCTWQITKEMGLLLHKVSYQLGGVEACRAVAAIPQLLWVLLRASLRPGDAAEPPRPAGKHLDQGSMGLPAPRESDSHPPTGRLSDISFQLCFPHLTPAQFSFLILLLFLPTPRALISLPSQVSSSRLLAVIFCPTWPSPSDASRSASKFGAQNLAIAP